MRICLVAPSHVNYRFNKHPLTRSYGQRADDSIKENGSTHIWEWCITVHLGCLFGSSYYMKPGSLFQHVGGNVKDKMQQ